MFENQKVKQLGAKFEKGSVDSAPAPVLDRVNLLKTMDKGEPLIILIGFYPKFLQDKKDTVK